MSIGRLAACLWVAVLTVLLLLRWLAPSAAVASGVAAGALVALL